ncbi:MAG: hypothetical protein LBS81_03765 [Endomicrobium sp.]|nr:hypothetical protein [Endomicrobium sp.]
MSNALNQLITAIPNTNERERIQKTLLTEILRQEINIINGQFCIYNTLIDTGTDVEAESKSEFDSEFDPKNRSLKDELKKLVEYRNSVETILYSLGVSDNLRAVRYIRQRNLIIKNEPDFEFSSLATASYKTTISYLDKMMAFNVSSEPIQENLPQEAKILKLLKILQMTLTCLT